MQAAAKVTKVKWYMRHYGAPTPKRHYGYANSSKVNLLDKGKLHAHQRLPKDQRVRTADAYTDARGVKRYKGNANLRPTQNLVTLQQNMFFYINYSNIEQGNLP